MIDLHSHSTASDGQYPPGELFALAARAGLRTLAVTDHDTVAGLAACAEAARSSGVALVPGIELSAFLDRREVHLLGHFVDPEEQRLASFAARLRIERHARMEQMVAKMRALGFPITMDDVQAVAGEAHLTRPHLARALVERRYCLTVLEAFERFLGDGKPAWVQRYRLSAEEAISLVRGAGGAATVAHPGVSKLTRDELIALAKAGVAGLEAIHPDHHPSLREKYLALARELSLVPTAGSDFHGETISLSRSLGMVSMGPEALEALRARRGWG